MSVQKYRLFRISLNISLAFLMTGLLYKLMHWPEAHALISIAYLISIVHAVIGPVDTYQDKNKKSLRPD